MLYCIHNLTTDDDDDDDQYNMTDYANMRKTTHDGPLTGVHWPIHRGWCRVCGSRGLGKAEYARIYNMAETLFNRRPLVKKMSSIVSTKKHKHSVIE